MSFIEQPSRLPLPSNCVLSIQLTSKIQLLFKILYSLEAEESHSSLTNSTTRREFFSTVRGVIFGNCTSFKLHQKVHFIQLTTEPAKYWLSTSRLFLLNRHDHHCITDSKTHHVLGCCASETVHIKSKVSKRCGNCFTSFAFWHHRAH